MKFTVQQYRGIKTAELDVAKIAFVAGKNFHGKTSLAQACGLVLTGDALPGKLAKKNVDLIIHGFGMAYKTAMIAVTGEKGSAEIDYPSAGFTTAGNPPLASRVAVGFDTPTRFTEKELSGFLAKILGTYPTKADLLKAIAPANLKAAEYEHVWNMAEVTGWDDAHATYKRQCAELKGEWRRVTGGENYGSLKAENWQPANWTPETVEALNERIGLLDGERIFAIRRGAVDESKLEELNALAGDIERAREIFQDKNAMALKLAEALKTLRKKPVPVVPTSSGIQACPKCKTMLTVKGGHIIAADGNTPLKVDVESAQMAQNLHYGEIQTAETAYTEAASARDKQEVYLENCEKAKLELDRIEADKSKGDPARSAEDLDVEIADLKAKVKAVEACGEARKLHERIVRGEIIVSALAEDGVRKVALETGLGKMNTALAFHCMNAKWNTVRINSDLSIWFGDVPYEFCSESEQYRVNATIQLVAAFADGSDIAIFDRADLLDSPGRNGLMTMLLSAGIPAIIFCTMNETKDVPNMTAHGVSTWWIEHGILKRLYE